MRLSSLGTAAMGVGAGTLSIDGVTPAVLAAVVAGDPNWLTTDEMIYADSGNGDLRKYDRATDVITVVDPDQHANDLTAGEVSKWAAWLSGFGVRSNLTGAIAVLNPLGSVGDMSEVGILATVLNAANGAGLRVYSDAGAVLFTRNVFFKANTGIRCRQGLVTFCDDAAGWQLATTAGVDVPFAVRVDTLDHMHPLTTGQRNWLIEIDQATGVNRVAVRESNANSGYVIALDIPTFNLDAIFLASGILRIGWSNGAGEAPNELRMMDLNLKNGANSTASSASGTLIWTVNPPIKLVSLPATGGTLSDLYEVTGHPIADQHGRITPPWQRYLADIQGAATGPINVQRLQGVVPPGNGGPGGQTQIDASFLFGTVPQATKWTERTITLTGVQAALDFQDADLLRCDNAALLSIAGLLPGVPAERLVILAVGSANVEILHDSASAAAVTNRIITNNAATVVLTPGDMAFLTRDATTGRWRVIALAAAAGAGSSPGASGGDHLHGLMRIVGDGAEVTFDLLDIAEYLEHVAVAGLVRDPLGVDLSADGSQLTFAAAPGAGEVVAIEYVIARL